jgi:dephospho-CoA kinase
MHEARPKKIIGIIGGIASGKSRVSEAFADNGCAVIDADRIAHKLLEDPEIKSQIRNIFGKEVISDENIDRPSLAKAAFESEKSLEKINSIVHPKVLSEIDKLIDQYNRDSNIRAIVLDVPLLLEVRWENKCDCLIFVECEKEIRVKRAQNKGISEEMLKKREKFQFSLDKKISLAHYIIHNNSVWEKTNSQIIDILSNIL